MSESTLPLLLEKQSPYPSQGTWVDFKRGDARVLTAVYQEHHADVLRLATFGCAGVRSVPEADREDIVQVVFCRVFSETARRAYDISRPMGAYIRAIARNTILDYWRRVRRTPRPQDVDVLEVPLEHSNALGYEHYPDLRRLSAATAAFWHSQPPELQRFVILRYIEEHSQRDLLEPTGWSRKQVRTREAAMRTELTAHLAAHGLLASDFLESWE